MHKSVSRASIHSITESFSRRMFRTKMFKINEMVKKDLKPYTHTLAIMSVGCSKILEVDAANALVDAIGETPHLVALMPCLLHVMQSRKNLWYILAINWQGVLRSQILSDQWTNLLQMVIIHVQNMKLLQLQRP